MVAAADWLARLRNSPINDHRTDSGHWWGEEPLVGRFTELIQSGCVGSSPAIVSPSLSYWPGPVIRVAGSQQNAHWGGSEHNKKVKVWEFLLHKSHQGREIKRGGEDEMTMMAFLLNWDGGLTHSIMVVNGGSAVLCHTKLFHPPTIPLRPDWEISTISSSSASFRVNNLRMTLWTDKD